MPRHHNNFAWLGLIWTSHHSCAPLKLYIRPEIKNIDILHRCQFSTMTLQISFSLGYVIVIGNDYKNHHYSIHLYIPFAWLSLSQNITQLFWRNIIHCSITFFVLGKISVKTTSSVVLGGIRLHAFHYT
jgi:hypothetical protein